MKSENAGKPSPSIFFPDPLAITCFLLGILLAALFFSGQSQKALEIVSQNPSEAAAALVALSVVGYALGRAFSKSAWSLLQD